MAEAEWLLPRSSLDAPVSFLYSDGDEDDGSPFEVQDVIGIPEC